MKLATVGVVLFAGLSAAHAAVGDVEAGKAKATTVCAACHGVNGISVADTIPNLAGQRGRYLEAQLRALKDGSRKNQLMNSIAAQLSATEISNLAAYFAALPGAPDEVARSEFLPNLAKTGVRFPENHKSFTKYATMNFPDTRQVRHYYANDVAMEAARSGKPLPDGSIILVEVYSAKLDNQKKPVAGPDGFFVGGEISFYAAMARQSGWGNDIPDILRNDSWNYAIFEPNRQQRARTNHAECFACHKPLHNESFLFTLKQLSSAAKGTPVTGGSNPASAPVSSPAY
jgi:cytochrome c553